MFQKRWLLVKNQFTSIWLLLFSFPGRKFEKQNRSGWTSILSVYLLLVFVYCCFLVFVWLRFINLLFVRLCGKWSDKCDVWVLKWEWSEKSDGAISPATVIWVSLRARRTAGTATTTTLSPAEEAAVMKTKSRRLRILSILPALRMPPSSVSENGGYVFFFFSTLFLFLANLVFEIGIVHFFNYFVSLNFEAN